MNSRGKFLGYFVCMLVIILAVMLITKRFHKNDSYIIDIPSSTVTEIYFSYTQDEDNNCIITVPSNSSFYKPFLSFFSCDYHECNDYNYRRDPLTLSLVLVDGTIITLPIITFERLNQTVICLDYNNSLWEMEDPQLPAIEGRNIFPSDARFIYSFLYYALYGRISFDSIQYDPLLSILHDELAVTVKGTVSIPKHITSGASSTVEKSITSAELVIIGKVISSPVEWDRNIQLPFPEDYSKLGIQRLQIEVLAFVSCKADNTFQDLEFSTTSLQVGDIITINGPFGLQNEKYTLGISQEFLELDQKYIFLVQDLFPDGLIPETRFWIADRSFGVLKITEDNHFAPLFNFID